MEREITLSVLALTLPQDRRLNPNAAQPELMNGTIDLTDLSITGIFNQTEVNPLDNFIGSSDIVDGSALQSTYAATDISAVDSSRLLESMLYNDINDYHSFI